MKNKLLKLILCLLLLTTCACDKDKPIEENKPIEESEKIEENINQISEKESKVVYNEMKYKGIKSFMFYGTNVDEELLNNLNHFEITRSDVIGDNVETYNGVKINDILEKLYVSEYKNLIILDKENKAHLVSSDKVNDNAFIVFYKDGKSLGYNKIVLLDEADTTWLEDVTFDINK